jgi:hypothetical protein
MAKGKELERGYFDFETDPFKRRREPKPFASDIYYDNVHLTTWSPKCDEILVRTLLDYRPRIWYAHNGGKFDFHLIIKYLPRKYIKRVLVIGGRITQIKFENGLEFRDSFALIPRALREWCKEDIDYSKLESDRREIYRGEISQYLKKDTEYLHEMVETFIETYGLHLTLASAAFQILHKQFNVTHRRISEGMDARFRKFYFAGRVEFYALGRLQGNYVCVDINSSFPYSMTKKHWEGDQFITLSTLPTKHLEQSFIRCKMKSTGAFPYRTEEGSVIFPADRLLREFYVTGWEYVASTQLGLLHDCCLLSVHVPINIRDYKDYINYFYKIKSSAESQGNKGERLFAKLLMNSGYGKFGIDPREFEEYSVCDYRKPPDNSEHWKIIKDDPNEGITIYAKPAKTNATSFNNVCVAASITGCSRAALLLALHSVDRAVYCDTDSIICSNIRNLSIGTKLGEWKIENEFDELHIGGKKLYAGHDKNTGKWKTASKGVKLTAQQIIEVSSGKTVEYEFESPSYSIRNIKANVETGSTAWVRFTKRKIRRADQMQNKILPKQSRT